MYSPRSVSTGRMPWRSRKSLRSISSVIIDLPLVTVRALAVAADVEHDAARLLGRLGPVHLAAGFDDLRLIGLQIEVEIVERVVLDVARIVAQPVEFGQRVDGLAPLVDEAAAHIAERLLQLRIGERCPGILLEGRAR